VTAELRSRLARACLRLYPRPWRDRYGEELLALVDESGGGIADVADLAIGGLRQRMKPLPGGPPMTPRVNPWQAGLAAVVAVLVAAPTAAFIAINLFPEPIAWLSGVRGVGVAPEAAWLVPALPFIATLVALAPAIRVGMRRDPSEGAATLTLRVLAMPRWLRAVAVVCAVLAGFVLAYGISENILEALRQAQ
jgi:hypothetical protein